MYGLEALWFNVKDGYLGKLLSFCGQAPKSGSWRNVELLQDAYDLQRLLCVGTSQAF